MRAPTAVASRAASAYDLPLGLAELRSGEPAAAFQPRFLARTSELGGSTEAIRERVEEDLRRILEDF